VGCSLGESLAFFERFLDEHIESGDPDHIVFEAPYIPIAQQPRFAKAGTAVARAPVIPMNAETVKKLMCLAGLIEKAGFTHSIPVQEATAGQIAKFFTGQARWGGREAKKAATMRVCRSGGYDVKDDNEADALALLMYAEATLYPQAARSRPAWSPLIPPDMSSQAGAAARSRRS
jgi:hypothetical protein